MKNKQYTSVPTFTNSVFLFGLIIIIPIAFLSYNLSKCQVFHFFNYLAFNVIIIFFPLYVSILLCFLLLKKRKFITLYHVGKIISRVNEAIVITDLKGDVQWVNKGFINMHGYTLKEVKRKNITDVLYGPLTNKEVGNYIVEKLRKGEVVNEDLLVYHKNREPIWISVSIDPTFDKRGPINGYVAIHKNINIRKVKELSVNALYKEIADYKFALDQSSGVIIFDIAGNILKANSNFCLQNELTLSKVVGQNLSSTISSMGNITIAKPIWNLLHEGLTWKGELITREAHDIIYWAHIIIVPLLDENDKPYNFLLIEKDITERKLLENKLESKSYKLQMALQIGFIGFWEIDINNIITLSDELRTLIKEPLNSPIDLAYLFERISPKDVEMIQNNLASTRTTFQRNDMEFQFLVHGEIHYLATSNTAQFNKEGEFIGLFGTMQDVTAFRLAELALRKSEKEKAKAMEFALIGSWGIDIDSVLTLSNELKTLIDEPKDAQIDLPYIFERMIPEDVLTMQNNLDLTRNTFQKNEMGFQYLVHGKTRYFTSTNTAQFNHVGEFIGLFGTVQDITEFKLIELALKKSEEEKAIVLNNTQAILCIHEMDGTLLYINQSAENILGFSNEETTGLNIRSFTDNDDIEIVDEYFSDVKNSDKVSGKIHIITKKGEKRLWLYQNTIYANKGNTPYVIASAIDITNSPGPLKY